ncbi:hypothetical protein ACHQM5_013055 [Ranunculus cassubicifolius]
MDSLPLLRPREENISHTREFNLTVLLYVVWNLALAVVSVVILFCSSNEHPHRPLRFWIFIDALQYALAVVLFLVYEYARFPSKTLMGFRIANTTISIIWWFIGLVWASSGVQINLENAYSLYMWTAILIFMPLVLILVHFITILCGITIWLPYFYES